MEPQQTTGSSYQAPEKKKSISVGVAIVWGLTAIIITAIIVGGIIFLRGADAIKNLKQIDVQVTDEPRNEAGVFNIKVDRTQ